jgi:hypothetical protein
MMIEPTKYRLRPKNSPSQPVSGMMMTLASMYPVETQAISSRLAPRLPIMSGRATLTIELSMTCISAASTTAKAIRYLCSTPSGGAASGSVSGSSESVASIVLATVMGQGITRNSPSRHSTSRLSFG